MQFFLENFVVIIIITSSISILIFRELKFLYLEKKKYTDSLYLSNLEKIEMFFETLQSINDYITWIKRDEIKLEYSDLKNYFKGKTHFYEKENKVEKFNDVISDFDNYIEKANNKYVSLQLEKFDNYFDDVEGKKLDHQQRLAVVTDEYSNLIIASAGSGKTLTVIGKVKYLIECKKINPKNILLLSFTKKTVSELNNRLHNIGLNVNAFTFHKLGYDILKKTLDYVPSLANDNLLNNVIDGYFQGDIFNEREALDAYIEYIACYTHIPEDINSFNSLGEKIENEKGTDYQTLKSKCNLKLNKVSAVKLDTFKGERVRSVEELVIANFLFLNGIEYEYEKRYPHHIEGIIYNPDFYLIDYDIYLEHFGVDENNQANWLSTSYDRQKYVDEMQIKRETHRLNKTKLIETFSYYNRDNILIDKLKELLGKEGVVFNPVDRDRIYKRINEQDLSHVNEVKNLIISFINLSKSRQLTFTAISNLFSDERTTKNNYLRSRQNLFLSFAIPVFRKFERVLSSKGQIDFNDMINQASVVIKEKKEMIEKYEYIIIDEYQDISFSRFNLIKQIRELSRARLICVGDDWQSIYRFAGSDISLFSNFEKHVGESKTLRIEQSYRYSQALNDVASKFIQKNPKQISKAPKSNKNQITNPIKYAHYSLENAEEVLINEIKKIIEKYGKKSILVLGRHSFDINQFIIDDTKSKIQYNERSNKLKIDDLENYDIKFFTVHKSKGLEADNVILLNVKNDLYGFPNKKEDDPILSLLLSDKEEHPYAEERRLFYVSLTRTKNEVVVLIPNDVSQFVKELDKDNLFHLEALYKNSTRKISCPYCQTGKLVIRKNTVRNEQFVGCSNYPGCNNTYNNIDIIENNIICPKCNSGFMTKRKGVYGPFMGCTNYPKCNSTINF